MTEHRVNPLQWLSTKFASLNHSHNEYLTTHQDITGKEDKSNKVTSISSSSTDTEYPSAKAVFDSLPSVPSASSVTPSADTTNGSVGDGTTWARSNHTHPKSSLYAEASHTHSQYLTSHQDITGKEDKSNKVTSLDDFSTDTEYPSAKAVYDEIWTDLFGTIQGNYVSNDSLGNVAFSNDYEDLDNKPTIPTATSDLTNDGDGTNPFLTEHQSLANYVRKSQTTGLLKNDGTVDTTNYSTFDGNYNNLTNKPSIPSNTSDLTNDSGFITNSSIPSASSTTPSADTTTGSVGTGITWARSDHTHPKSSLYAEATHTHNATEIQDSSAHGRIGSGANDNQANINDSIDIALTELDNNILNAKWNLVGFQTFQVKDFINPNNWENSGCTYSDGVLTFSESNSFTATFPTDSLVSELADFELSFDYIIDDGLVLDDTISFEIFGFETGYTVTEEDIDNGYVIIDVSFKSENNQGIITSEMSGDEFPIDYVNELNPYTINAITPVGDYTKIANIRYKANNIISLNDNKEDVYNKVTSLSSSSTDTQYPSAKAVYDAINKQECYFDGDDFVIISNEQTITKTLTIMWVDQNNKKGIRPRYLQSTINGITAYLSEESDWSVSVPVDTEDTYSWSIPEVLGYTVISIDEFDNNETIVELYTRTAPSPTDLPDDDELDPGKIELE